MHVTYKEWGFKMHLFFQIMIATFITNITLAVDLNQITQIQISPSTSGAAKFVFESPFKQIQMIAHGLDSNNVSHDLTQKVVWSITGASNTAISLSNELGSKGILTINTLGSTEIEAKIPSTNISKKIPIHIITSPCESYNRGLVLNITNFTNILLLDDYSWNVSKLYIIQNGELILGQHAGFLHPLSTYKDKGHIKACYDNGQEGDRRRISNSIEYVNENKIYNPGGVFLTKGIHFSNRSYAGEYYRCKKGSTVQDYPKSGLAFSCPGSTYTNFLSSVQLRNSTSTLSPEYTVCKASASNKKYCYCLGVKALNSYSQAFHSLWNSTTAANKTKMNYFLNPGIRFSNESTYLIEKLTSSTPVSIQNMDIHRKLVLAKKVPLSSLGLHENIEIPFLVSGTNISSFNPEYFLKSLAIKHPVWLYLSLNLNKPTIAENYTNFETKFSNLKRYDDLTLAGLTNGTSLTLHEILTNTFIENQCGTVTLPTVLNPSNLLQELNSYTMPLMN